MPDLFDLETRQPLQDGALLLRGRALPVDKALIAAIDGIAARAPFRRMVTPGGFQMSVAMTNCGSVGWVTDRTGYRYDARDPESGASWPGDARRIPGARARRGRRRRAFRASCPTPA